MKILYVLVSSTDDFYYEQTYVSILSLKHVDPAAKVTLLVDDLTNDSLVGDRENIKKIVDEYVCISLDSVKTNKERSRYLKTSMRKLVKGDFLYVDSDTLWASSLNESDFTCDVMAVLDGHCRVGKKFCSERTEPLLKKLGYNPIGKDYVNSGVMFWKDSAKARIIQERWHALWNQCLNLGFCYDQPALNRALEELSFDGFRILKNEYNAQIVRTWDYLFTSKIIHYYTTLLDGESYHHVFQKKVFWEYVRKCGIDDYVRSIIENPRGAIEKPYKICGKDEIELQQTKSYGFLKDVFKNRGRKKTFGLIEKIVAIMAKIRNVVG